MRWAVAIATLVALLGACGGPPSCPLTPPADGSNCDHRSLVCETGGDAHRRCSTVSACQDKLDPKDPAGIAWSVTPPATACTTTNDVSCAATFGGVIAASVCPTAGATCDYTEGRCACVSCNPTGLNWRCRAWAEGLNDRCPSERPLIGSRCDDLDGLQCRYDDRCGVSLGPDLVCFGGVWTLRLGAPRACAEPVCGISD
jgi:hypothetical protein